MKKDVVTIVGMFVVLILSCVISFILMNMNIESQHTIDSKDIEIQRLNIKINNFSNKVDSLEDVISNLREISNDLYLKVNKYSMIQDNNYPCRFLKNGKCYSAQVKHITGDKYGLAEHYEVFGRIFGKDYYDN